MNESPQVVASTPRAVDRSLVTYTHVIYALHGLSVIIGITGSASVVGAFVFGLPSIAGVVMNYVRQNEVRGSWLESHFRWQIRSFWYALLWWAIIAVLSAPLVLLLGLGLVTYFLGVFVLAIWLAYRVVRGWLALREGRSMYV